jgi:ribosomal protein L11 methylase PrmA
MNAMRPVAGSHRDPAGRVYDFDGRILRSIAPEAEEAFFAVMKSGVLKRLAEREQLIDFAPATLAAGDALPDRASQLIEHPRLDFVSFPYEWSFEALRCAALHHLDVHMDAMRDDITLSDSSAYNVQFIGARPVFIDLLSFRPYVEGELWAGYGQFCEQFLNPLLLYSVCGVSPNPWYRGALEGIPASDLRRLLPIRSKLSRRMLLHVVVHGMLERAGSGGTPVNSGAGLPRARFIKLLADLRAWIEGLKAPRRRTAWTDYGAICSYSDEEQAKKRAEVETFAAETRPRQLWDIGCNTGDYALAALKAGAQSVIGWDGDPGAVDAAFLEARRTGANFTPLLVDLANPSPAQGWNQSERPGLQERASADAAVALAVVHHMVLTRNIPMPQAVAWLVGLAPRGLIEFVPPDDVQVRRMLTQRQGLHHPYDREHFVAALSQVARLKKSTVLGQSGREMFWYERNR